jgi:hypothetical protein
MDMKSAKKLSLEWVKHPNGVSLFFDQRTWALFSEAAKLREQSAEHMITRAIVESFGTILEDNMVLNRILRAHGDEQRGPKAAG